MVDFKYHLLTITAVFLALTVGIVIGMALPGTELFSRQQQAALADLENSLTKLKVQTGQQETQLLQLSDQLYAAEELGHLLYPLLLAERLSQVKIGVIKASEEGSDQIRKALSAAGAELVWEIQVDEAETMPSLVQTFAQHGNPGISIVSVDTSQELLESVDQVILLGPFNNQLFSSLQTLKQTLLEANIPLIGAQAWNGFEARPFFVDLPIHGVDNVNTPAGLVSLVALLLGEKGHFGGYQSADALLPKSVNQWLLRRQE